MIRKTPRTKTRSLTRWARLGEQARRVRYAVATGGDASWRLRSRRRSPAGPDLRRGKGHCRAPSRVAQEGSEKRGKTRASVAGEFVGMLDGVDDATRWVEVRAMWGRGQAGTLAG